MRTDVLRRWQVDEGGVQADDGWSRIGRRYGHFIGSVLLRIDGGGGTGGELVVEEARNWAGRG